MSKRTNKPTPQPPEKMTLADHAEAWTRERGEAVPHRESPEWKEMYERWVTFAFADLQKNRRKHK